MIATRRVLAALLLGLIGMSTMACSDQSPPASSGPASSGPTSSGPTSSGPVAPSAAPPDPLRGLVDVAVRRIVLGDQVSAAKFGTPAPIDDPPREQQVLAQVGSSAGRAGVDPGEAARFFGDQIAASKVVQRGLYQRWTEHPDQAPTSRPDLRTQVRPELDTITTQLIDGLRDTTGPRHAPGCASALNAASTHAGGQLDQLHRDALVTALRGVCVHG